MTRPARPDSRPVALTVAGSDSGGGAGVQADVRTMSARGAFATSVVTAVTAQHTRGVDASAVLDPELVRAQLDAVRDDFDVRAAKTGMLGNAAVVDAVADAASEAFFPLVVDPVLVATSGDRLLTPDGERAYEDLLAHATLATPNRAEASALTGVDVTDVETAEAAGTALREMGADAALVTGGHGDGDVVRDVLVTADGAETLAHPRVDTAATHGSGCLLSAAAAAGLARGDDVATAVADAVSLADRAVIHPLDVGRGAGAVHAEVELRDEAARRETAEAVRDVVAAVREMDAAPLVPEVGTNVVGATPYADSVTDVAAVDGRLTRTRDGVTPTGGVRFGASDHLARFLLVARDHCADRTPPRFAANVGLSPGVRAGLDELDGPVAWFDRADQPSGTATMDWSARETVGGRETVPVAVADRGAHGKEAMVRVLAQTADALRERLGTLARAARRER
ncbi:MAG: bifunctional hydroxymethylpyrimidine kinase/phosphomethylpyrimidine kinase [Halarchaeum sp.]